MREFLRAILWKGIILAAGWVLIAIGVASLRLQGDQLGIALVSLVLIGAGVLLGLGAQVSTPPPHREWAGARPHRDRAASPAGVGESRRAGH